VADREFLLGQLAQIQSRYSGKVPLGPLDDLGDLYASQGDEGRAILLGMLKERADDRFWSYFVRALFKKLGVTW
jgi:hypothetical protein